MATVAGEYRPDQSSERSALVVAHPGHELRVHGWLEVARPTVFVLTDGSGSRAMSRLPSTTQVLDAAGARRGIIYGWFSDRAFYDAILNQDLTRFADVLDELASAFMNEGITCVAADAAEGYNPAHDVCRWIADAAVTRAAAMSGVIVRSYEFPLVARPDALVTPELAPRAVRVDLTDAALHRKLQAARSYAELRQEVEAALHAWGPDAFRSEWLTPAVSGARAAADGWSPSYEAHGEDRVEARVYSQVIRYASHLAPIADTLHRHARPAST